MSLRSSLSKLLVALVALAGGTAAFAQPTPPQTTSEARADPETQPDVPNAGGRPKPANPHATKAASIALDRPSADEIAQRMAPPVKGAPLQVGFGRDIPAAASEAALHGLLNWETLPSGAQVAAVRFNSPGALALRVGLRIVALPPTAILRFYAPGGAEMYEVDGEEILDTIARNLDAGDNGPDARTFWSPIVEGETAVVEIEMPANTRPQDLHLAAPQLSHFVNAPRDTLVEKVSSCQLDAVCYDSTWGTESMGVARMLFVVSGSSYVCTGTLLADNDTSTTIPYFLSANHCISTQTVASTLQTTWKYRSTSCNGGAASSYPVVTGGATLLYATTNTDTSFMRLNNPPPAGSTYNGWLAASPSLNTQLTGLHHPGGGLEKISFASLNMYATCTASSGGSFQCAGATTGTAGFFGVTWNQGLTEGGSSGSGLFLNSGHYLIGQLYGGSSACGTSIGPDFYGRFDVAYNAALSQWLSPPTNRTLTVSKSGNGSGTVTSSPAGISCGATCSANFTNNASVTLSATPSGTSVFSGWSGSCLGTGTCALTMDGNLSVTATFNDPALTPGAPQSLVGTAGNGQATFTFVAPTNTGGSAISRYTVTCNPGALVATNTTSPVTMTGLANGTTYTCSATATNATTTGPASNSVSVTPAAVPLALVSVASRSNHGFTTYDLPIDLTKPITGAITVEPRIDGTHRVVFHFNAPIVSTGTVTVTDVNGAPIGAAFVGISNGDLVVSLSGVDGRRVRVAAQGVNGTLNVAANVGFLVGDELSTGAVTASDILRARGRAGTAFGSTNYLYDVNLDSSLTTDDVTTVKNSAGQSIR